MTTRDTYRNTLIYALAIAGSQLQLAQLLEVKVPQLMNWLNGVDDIPDRVFFKMIDVVAQSSPEAISRSRGLLAKFSKSVITEQL
jgi:DNA-binding transcriptional regulator YdaS (Cro superfamily)